jgi:hypothetical protein
LFGHPALAATVMLPLSLMLAAMFFSSVYGTFRDCFVHELPEQPRIDEIV